MFSNLFKNGAIASVCVLLTTASTAQETFHSLARMNIAHKEINYRLPMFDVAQKIKVQMIDGHAIFEGDIVLYNENDPANDAGISGNNYRWSNGVIPYEIAAGHPRAAEINQAMAIMNQKTKLCIKPRTNEADYVRFINGSGCYSNVGRKGGVQDISISAGCAFGSIMHEMLHAAGMYHEQSRSDRDNYITILTANIQSGYEHNFDKVSSSISSCAYDFGSIMHYPLTAFSANGQPTIKLKVAAPAGVTIGQRTAMSACDISGVHNLYPNATGCGGCAPFKVYGVIGTRYTQLGGASSFLKCPLTDETGTPDGKGRFNHFQGGSIYWHPTNPAPGAFVIYGDIKAKWAKLGWEVKTGYPITDEMGCPDGVGRYNHFRKYNAAGQAVGDLSIYWHPTNPGEKAFLIYGAIRDKWALIGWEKSPLGYPITDELPAVNNGRVNYFQHGALYWSAAKGAVVLLGKKQGQPLF